SGREDLGDLGGEGTPLRLIRVAGSLVEIAGADRTGCAGQGVAESHTGHRGIDPDHERIHLGRGGQRERAGSGSTGAGSSVPVVGQGLVAGLAEIGGGVCDAASGCIGVHAGVLLRATGNLRVATGPSRRASRWSYRPPGRGRAATTGRCGVRTTASLNHERDGTDKGRSEQPLQHDGTPEIVFSDRTLASYFTSGASLQEVLPDRA